MTDLSNLNRAGRRQIAKKNHRPMERGFQDRIVWITKGFVEVKSKSRMGIEYTKYE